MKITFEYSTGGRKYNSFEAALQAAVENGVKNLVTKKLLPFHSQLSNSAITVIAKNSSLENYSISVANVPDEIREQVQQALSE